MNQCKMKPRKVGITAIQNDKKNHSDQRRSFPVDLGCGERSAAYDGGKGSVITSLTWATQEMSR